MRLFSRRVVGRLIYAGCFRVKDRVLEDGSILVGEESGRWRGTGVQESGISKQRRGKRRGR
jgi:hypothetical protein